MNDHYYRLVNIDYEPIDSIIDTDLANASDRIQMSLKLAPIFNIILQFWIDEKVQLDTACSAVTHLDLYLSQVQEIERNGAKYIPTAIINTREKIERVDLLAIKKVIFPYIDYYENTGDSITDDDLKYIWEYLFEVYRKNYAPQNLSRFSGIFMFDNKDNLQDFKMNYHLVDDLVECECKLVTTKKIESHDMRWIDSIPLNCTFEDFCELSKNYWSGKQTSDPIVEYLFSGKYLLSRI